MSEHLRIMPLKSRLDKYRAICVARGSDGVNRYRIVPHFNSTSFEGMNEGISSEIFRSFVPIKPSSGRNMRGASFDKNVDSLFDYPNIISSKLGLPWQYFNLLLSVHIASCPLNCWYCYVDECLRLQCDDCHLQNTRKCLQKTGRFDNYEGRTAEEIYRLFLREHNNSANRINVLRITGGEPFLAPELIHELLSCIRKDNLDSRLFIWAETNLVPFLRSDDGRRYFQRYSKITIEDLSSFNNWALHPCLHGVSSDNILAQTGARIELDDLLDALDFLIRSKIDIYPTIASNLCSPSDLQILFNKLRDLHQSLPLRFALVEYDFGYPPVYNRISSGTVEEKSIYDQGINIKVWNDKCMEAYGHEYAQIPREKIDVDLDISRIVLEDVYPHVNAEILREPVSRPGNYVYLLKSCYRPKYKQELLSILALPSDAPFKIEYREDLLHESLRKIIENHSAIGLQGVLIYLDQNCFDPSRFIPVRYFIINDIERIDDAFVVIHMITKDYVKANTTEAPFGFGEKLSEIIGEGLLPMPKTIGHPWAFCAEKPYDLLCSSTFKKVVDRLCGGEEGPVRPDFIDCCFLRVSGPNRLPVRQKLNKRRNVHPERNEAVASVKGGYEYSIKVQFYNPHYDSLSEVSKQTTMTLRAHSQGGVYPSGRSGVPTAKYGSERLDLSINESVRPYHVDLEISPDPHTFNFPIVDLKLRVRNVSKAVVSFVGIMIAFGAIVLSQLLVIDNSWKIVITCIGSVLLAVSTFSFSGKIPTSLSSL